MKTRGAIMSNSRQKKKFAYMAIRDLVDRFVRRSRRPRPRVRIVRLNRRSQMKKSIYKFLLSYLLPDDDDRDKTRRRHSQLLLPTILTPADSLSPPPPILYPREGLSRVLIQKDRLGGSVEVQQQTLSRLSPPAPNPDLVLGPKAKGVQTAPSFYLNTGNRLARLVFHPTGEGISSLEDFCSLEAFKGASLGFVAHNDQLFGMGNSIGFQGEDYKGPQEEFCLYWCNHLNSEPLLWTVLAPTPAVEILPTSCPYLVHMDDDDKVYMFGDRYDFHPDTPHKWACVFDCKTQSWNFMDPPFMDPDYTSTRSHFIWEGKVYLLIHRIQGDRDKAQILCSFDPKTNLLSNEIDLCQSLRTYFHNTKMVVVNDNVLLVFDLSEGVIRPFDLKAMAWIVQDRKIEMESLCPDLDRRERARLLDFDDYRGPDVLFIVKSPAHEDELFLLWQVGVRHFFTSRIRVLVKKGGTEVRVKVVQECVKLDCDPCITDYGYGLPAIATWS